MLDAAVLLERLHKLPEGAGGLQALDCLFLRILQSLCQNVTSDAASAAYQVVQLSESILDHQTSQAFKDFHNLYFGSGELLQLSESVSREVDAILAGAQTGAGASDDSSEASRARLRLAEVQQRLEYMISADNELREQAVPIIASLQFVDMLQQNLQQLVDVWLLATAPEHQALAPAELEQHLRTHLHSQLMLKLFHTLVLKQPFDSTDERAIDDIILQQLMQQH